MQSSRRIVEAGWALARRTQDGEHEIGLVQQGRLVVLHADTSLDKIVAHAYHEPQLPFIFGRALILPPRPWRRQLPVAQSRADRGPAHPGPVSARPDPRRAGAGDDPAEALVACQVVKARLVVSFDAAT